MGAYENPPIIRDTSGQILAQGFEDFSKSMAGAIIAYGEKKEKESEKKEKFGDDLLKAQIELRSEAQKLGTKWYEKASAKNKELADGFRPLVSENLKKVSDAKLELNYVKDTKRREELFDLIKNSETNLQGLGSLLETVYTDSDEFKKNDIVADLGKTIMFFGDDTNQKEANQQALKALVGISNKDSYTINYEENNDYGYVLNISGTNNGKPWVTSLNSREAALGKGLIFDMTDTVSEGANKVIQDITGGSKNINEAYLAPKVSIDYEKISTNPATGKKSSIGRAYEDREYIDFNKIENNIIIPNSIAKAKSFVSLGAVEQNAIFKYQLGQDGNLSDFTEKFKNDPEGYEKAITNLYSISIKKELNKNLDNTYKKDESGAYYRITNYKFKEPEKPKEEKPPKQLTSKQKLIDSVNNKEKEIYISSTLKYELINGKYQAKKMTASDGISSWEDIMEGPKTPDALAKMIEQIK